MISLYDDQQELLDSVRNSMRHGNKSVLMTSPTGSGKTVVAASMIAGTRAKGTRCMILVPRRELLKQTGETLDNYDMPYSYVASGYATNPYAKTFIGIAQTLVKRLDKAPALDVLIVDECHVGGEGLNKIIQHYKQQGAYIIGLSASPIRLDGRGLDCWFDDMVCGKSIRWLIDNKRLSDYKLFAPSRPDLSGIKKTAGDLNKGELNDFMMEDKILIGDAAKYYKEYAMGKLCVTFSVSRAHSLKIAEEYRSKGIPSYHIDGSMDDAERSRIIKAFARREILQLVNCDLLTYGFDLASAAGIDVCVEAMTDLRPTQSLALCLQKWGRVLRKKDEPALIFDHSSNVHLHGLPCQDREWKLHGTEKRSGGGREKTIPCRQCESCFFVHAPAPKCPNCGLVYPIQSREIEHIDGELVQITSVSPRNEQGMQRDLKSLIAYGYKTGKKRPEAWAAHVMSARMQKRKK